RVRRIATGERDQRIHGYVPSRLARTGGRDHEIRAVPPGGDRDHVRPAADFGGGQPDLALLLQSGQNVGFAGWGVPHLGDRVDIKAPILAARREVAGALEPIAFERDLPTVLAAQLVNEG